MKRSLVLFTTLICSIFILGGCSEKLGDFNVYLGGKVKETEDQIIIEGETNLLEGARVNGTVYVNEDEVFSESTELIDEDGKFHMEMDHHKYGDAEVVVTFDFVKSMQDDKIVEHYGEGGKNLEGTYVYVDEHWNEGVKKAEVRLPLAFDDEATTHEFTEPTWGERPEDYGDARVWIKVDDIKDDGEYFYLHGTSNLLEGSEIKGYYASSLYDDKTRVNPDGSFDLKIEYRYEEDEAFVIRFNPRGQWKTIQEQYGSDGEKLIGKLVKTSGSSQEIELVIEYEHK